MALRDELVEVIRDCDVELDGELKHDSSLIQSGLLDSLALFTLTVWIEEQLDRELDLTAFDLASEWDTMADILRFLEEHRDREGDPGAGP